MHRWWKAFFLSVILACAAAGCLDYEEEMTLDTKGAGVVRIHYYTDETTAQLLEGEDSPFALDQKAVEERLEGNAAKLRSLDVYSANGQRHAVLEIEFAGPEKLAGNWPFEGRTFSLSRRDDGLYVYRTVIGLAADEETGQDGSAGIQHPTWPIARSTGVSS
ncbi:MAG: hypothetical protein ACM3XS_06350 [Bacteroidota bacterium]